MRTTFWQGRPLVSLLGPFGRPERALFRSKRTFFRSKRTLFRLKRFLCLPEKGLFRPKRTISGGLRALKAAKGHSSICLPERRHCVGRERHLPAREGPLSDCITLFWYEKALFQLKVSLRFNEKSLCCPKRAFFRSKWSPSGARVHSVRLRRLCTALRGFLSA